MGDDGVGGCCCFQCVNSSEVGLIEYCGQYSGLAQPGLTVMMWPCSVIAGRISLRVRELTVDIETKTRDNVFVQMEISVQFQAMKDKVYDAYYQLQDVEGQMRAYVRDTVRSTVPRMALDEVFAAKDDVARSVRENLSTVMESYGYTILQSLVKELNPAQNVKNAMNEINASKRNKAAAEQKAEGDKVVMVKNAEAASEAAYLSGVGVARQRRAIVDGVRDSVADFGEVNGTTPKQIMDLLLLTQYLDAMSEIGRQPGSRVVFVPQADGSILDQVRSAGMQASAR